MKESVPHENIYQFYINNNMANAQFFFSNYTSKRINVVDSDGTIWGRMKTADAIGYSSSSFSLPYSSITPKQYNFTANEIPTNLTFTVDINGVITQLTATNGTFNLQPATFGHSICRNQPPNINLIAILNSDKPFIWVYNNNFLYNNCCQNSGFAQG
jgi:hypothetical protein